jgi:hypothetical protein
MSRGLTLEQIEFLVSKGVSAEEMLAFAQMGAAKSKGAERTARWRAKKNGTVTESVTRDVTSDASPPPTDIYSNPLTPSEANASPPPLEAKLVSEWNSGPGANGARRATKLDASRKALLKARLRDYSEPELFEAMGNLAASRFHCGENDRGWRASLGWFLKAENFLKALEMGPPSPQPANDLAALAARYGPKSGSG